MSAAAITAGLDIEPDSVRVRGSRREVLNNGKIIGLTTGDEWDRLHR